jgi:hypothetical protein
MTLYQVLLKGLLTIVGIVLVGVNSASAESTAENVRIRSPLGRPSPGPGGGATTYQADQVMPGYTLYSSAHAPIAYLIDRQGEVVHQWSAPIDRVFPRYNASTGNSGDRPYYWRYVRLLEGGELLAIFEGIGIVRLDKDSNVIWSKQNGAHHWVDVAADGNFVMLTRRWITASSRSYLEDAISVLSPDGRSLQRISLPTAVNNSRFSRTVFRSGTSQNPTSWSGDILHTNSVHPLPAGVALPKGATAGDLLVSMRTTNSLAIVSRRSKRVVWARRGIFKRQHAATITADGSILLFDNVGSNRRGTSRVLRLAFPDAEAVEKLERLGESMTFFTRLLGAVSQLPNGNLLIVESEGGRLFEVSSDRTLVWEYLSPHRGGSSGELMAVLAHAERVPAALITSWLEVP